MSIIHDALKKVQHTMEKNPSSVAPINISEDKVEVLPSASSKDRKQSNPILVGLLIFLCLIVITLSGLYMLSQIQNKDPHFMPKVHFNFPLPSQVQKMFNKPKLSQAAKHQPLAQITIPKPSQTVPVNITQTLPTPPPTPSPSIPAVPSSSNDSLTIQGIMASGAQNIALINNKIYEEGSMINDIKILKINLNTITIQRNGKEEIIAVKK